jgi:hydroxymethylpyrimidine/phosphomethylpyrimidine kinase
MARTPIALTIAGSDSSGGAGIQADLKTFSALGVYGASVLTALTAQNTTGVQGVLAIPPAFVSAQMDSVFADLAVDAIKTGMLANAAIVRAVATALSGQPAIPVVVDPVMVATSGDLLLEPDAVAAITALLLPRADLVTPNLPEAARLSGEAEAASVDAMERQGRIILDRGARAVLVKGGHGSGAEAIDVLVTRDGVRVFAGRRVGTPHTHGTGCTLSSAIAALRARGLDLADAVGRAKTYVRLALEAGRDLGVGHGHGPVDHLYAARRLDLPPAE